MLQQAVKATEFMLPTMPVTEPTHWVPAIQFSLTSVLPLSRLQNPPVRFTGRNTGGLDRLNLVTKNVLVTEKSAAPTIPSVDSRLTNYRVYQLQSLPVTEKSAAPTIPVLKTGSLVTEFTGYRDSVVPTIPVLTAGSPDTEFSGYRVSPVRTAGFQVTEKTGQSDSKELLQ